MQIRSLTTNLCHASLSVSSPGVLFIIADVIEIAPFCPAGRILPFFKKSYTIRKPAALWIKLCGKINPVVSCVTCILMRKKVATHSFLPHISQHNEEQPQTYHFCCQRQLPSKHINSLPLIVCSLVLKLTLLVASSNPD